MKNMEKNTVKYIPILLIGCLLIDAINIFISTSTSIGMGILKTFSTLIITSSIAFLIFYSDLKKKNSDLAKVGLLCVAGYILLTIIYIIASQTMNLSFVSVVHKIQYTLANFVNCFKYLSIIHLISEKTNNPIAEKAQTGAVITNILYYFLCIIAVWISIDKDSIFYKITTLTYDAFRLCVITFILYQLLDSKELQEVQQIPQQMNNTGMNPMMNNGIQQQMVNTTPNFLNSTLPSNQNGISNVPNTSQQMDQSQYFHPFDNPPMNNMQQPPVNNNNSNSMP